MAENNRVISGSNMPALFFIAFILWITPQTLYAENPKTLTIAADIWCPINCVPDTDLPGIGVDLAKAVFEPLGYKVIYTVMPWTRALEEARAGRIDIIIGANSDDDAALLFPKHAIFYVKDGIYSRTEYVLDYHGVESLKGHSIGVIRDYGYSKPIRTFIDEYKKNPGKVQEVGGRTGLEQNIRKLLAGRIDVLIESQVVMDYNLKRLHLEDRIRLVSIVPQDNVYLAFSPALKESEARIREFDAGIERLKKEGKVKALYAPYGMEAP